MIKKIRKRDGKLVLFEKRKIINAIFKSAQDVGGQDIKESERLADEIEKLLNEKFKTQVPTVEDVQDLIEKTLIEEGHAKVAKNYILYRQQKKDLRETKEFIVDSIKLVDDYINKEDWRVYENANATYSVPGLSFYSGSTITTFYALNHVYPKEIANAHTSGCMHIHNLQMALSAYCAGWSLRALLHEGFNGVPGKIECSPPKHLRSAVGQMINFIGTLQNEWAGAQAFNSFDTYLAPFVRKDNLDYKEIKQCIQEFIYNMNVSSRWAGGQTPFTNVTLDLNVPEDLAEQKVTVGGKFLDSTYSDYKDEINLINKAFIEVLAEGDAKGRVFTFPIPTYNLTKDFDWDSEISDKLFEVTAKYGLPYFQNFLNSDLNPRDIRAMCCHLRLDLKELHRNVTSGRFGSGESTGSIGVVTINLPHLAYEAKNEVEFFEKLERCMYLAKESLEIKRKFIERNISRNLLPYTKRYLGTLKNHFSTIGIIGMHEACLNLLGKNKGIQTKEGHDFSIKVLKAMREKLLDYQEETGNIYNLEATPGEGASYRLAMKDKKQYPKIVTSGKKEPYYTNSTHLPVSYTSDIFSAIKHQEPLQKLYTGGCVEKGNKVLTDKGLFNIEYIAKNFKKLKPIKALSCNPEKGIGEWDEITDAMSVDVKEKDKIRIMGERNLDITTSNWHPFFVLDKIKINPSCPICKKKIKNKKSFAVHLRYSKECREKYKKISKYELIEKRADNLKVKDYILQNFNNLYPNKTTGLSKDLMWLIGFFIGDGSISKFVDNRGGNELEKYLVRFHSEHIEALKKVKKILWEYFRVESNIIKNDKRSKKLRELSTSKKSVWEFFFKYGFKSGKKVYDVCITKKVKENLTKENVFSLLSGLADSDGHINKRDGDFEYSTVSSQLADDILEVCSCAGMMVSKKEKLTKRKNEVNIYRLRIPQYQMTKIKDKLDITVNPLRIKRDLSNRKRRYFPIVRVKEISKNNVKDNQFYDLTTKNNHNYLAGKNSLVFVHNTVFHTFLGESIEKDSCSILVKKIASQFTLPYFTITPTFSICEEHGYLKDEQKICPKCHKATEVYSRVVGYLRPVKDWNLGKQSEFNDRKVFVPVVE